MDFERTDISFALKSYHPLPYRHTHDLTAQQIKDGVFQATRLQEMMREVNAFVWAWVRGWGDMITSSSVQIAEERSVKVEEVEKEVRQLLDEIGHTMHLAAVRTLAFILRGPIRRVIRGIHINAGGLEKVRERMRC